MTRIRAFVIANGLALLVSFQLSAQSSQRRVAAKVRLQEDQRIVDLEAKWFGNPVLLGTLPDGVVVYDIESKQLVCFGHDGWFRWRAGRSGQGPGEFTGVTDLHVDTQGSIWVLDPGNARFSIWTSAGKLVREIRSVQYTSRFLPLAAGTFFGNSVAKDEFAALFGPDGTKVRRISGPAGLDTLHWMSLEYRLVSAPSDEFVLYFRWSSRLIGFSNSGKIRFDAPGVDAVTVFPQMKRYALNAKGAYAERIDPAAQDVTISACATSTHILVLSGFGKEKFGKVVDRYRLSDGSYLDTITLPQAATVIDCADGVLRTLVDDPEPAIVRYKLRY